MDVKLILIILLGILLFAFMGIALHMANTIRQLRQYIGELERDYRIANDKLMGYDSTADHQ